MFVIDPSVPGLAPGVNPIPISQGAEDTTISAAQQFLNEARLVDQRPKGRDDNDKTEIIENCWTPDAR